MTKESYGPWNAYGVCECGFKTRAPFADTFHIHIDVCPECGCPKYRWTIKTMRRVSYAQWWRPSTWGKGRWEEWSREEDM